ncbi:NADH-quinone oxidoreductase subunit J [Desulfohalobiaceae bacterium Ax17]|uniref:NADH-quinone oxidoreductase subunit J family protein n=1 Tax=Desulfovulcanus ferrireducens TaxID=2831190 RepID=UPI00207BA662|nr:NADH-quinone oxidoreductase subunit J [Desulfovulcanus ferrireducens]MBT8763672.1 NADH-quinone oxidoreductase subunit J [Desulfovulcanus ferrireducens]
MLTLAYVVLIGHLALILCGGFITILAKSLVRALTGLIMTLFGVAGLYFLMAAPFIGLMQILIYVGAVSVLIFFAIMLTQASSTGEEGQKKRRGKVKYAVMASLAPAIFLGLAVIRTAPPGNLTPQETSVKFLGRFLLGPYALPFELISLVLFVAMAGAVLLGFEKRIPQAGLETED